jgi:hypothetical protein
MKTAQLAQKISPTIATETANLIRKPAGLFTKQGVARVAEGAGIGYGYDVTQGLQGQRGEDRMGAEAFIPGAGTLLGAAIPTATGAYRSVKNKFDKGLQLEKIISKREQDIADIQNNYAKTRKQVNARPDANVASRRRVAGTDVLVNSVDQDGLIRTKQPGGAVDLYEAQTIAGKEGTVRQLLEREGGSITPESAHALITKSIKESGLTGAQLKSALNNVDDEVAGLMVKADRSGNIPLTAIHDAKIGATKGIKNWIDPYIQEKSKALASAYRGIVEKTSNEEVQAINKELQKYYGDLELLASLDGKRVKGGRLGKYFATISGNLIGGATGAAIGGPGGSAIGAVVGGEVAGRVKGNFMSRAFGKALNKTAPKSAILEEMAAKATSPRLMLPAPEVGALRSAVRSGPTINLPSETVTTKLARQAEADVAYSKSLGSRNQQYSPIPTTSKSSIPETIALPKENINSPVDISKTINEYKGIPKGGKISNPNAIILNGDISNDVASLIGTKNTGFELSNKALKHIVEERPQIAERVVKNIPDVLANPDKVAPASIEGRFRFVKRIDNNNVVVLEVTKTPGSKNQVVSAFITDNKTYNKLENILGGSESPSLSKNSSGIRVSAVEDTTNKSILPLSDKSSTQGGYIKGADGKNVPKIHVDDKREMKDFIDYVASDYTPTGKEALDLELSASRIAERYNIKNFKSGKGLANEFARILDDQPLSFGKIAANPLVAGAGATAIAAGGVKLLNKPKNK